MAWSQPEPDCGNGYLGFQEAPEPIQSEQYNPGHGEDFWQPDPVYLKHLSPNKRTASPGEGFGQTDKLVIVENVVVVGTALYNFYKIVRAVIKLFKTEARELRTNCPQTGPVETPISLEKASTPTRQSKDQPPSLSGLENNLVEHAASFIREFDSREQKIIKIVGELREIADENRKMQETTGKVRTAGVVTGVVGTILGAIAVPLTGGLSVVAAVAGIAAGAAGGVVVAGVDITKLIRDYRSAKKVDKLGKEFMEIIEPLKNYLEEMMLTFEEFVQMSVAELEVGGVKVQSNLKKVFVGVKRIGAVLSFTHSLIVAVEAMVALAVAVYTKKAPLAQLKMSISYVVKLSQNVIDEFGKMKKLKVSTNTAELKMSISDMADLCQKAFDGFGKMKKVMEELKVSKNTATAEELVKSIRDVVDLSQKVFDEFGKMK